MKRYAFDVMVGDKPYTCELEMEAADVWDAHDQLRETLCNRYSRDPDDFKTVFKQAKRQFMWNFVKALDAGRVLDVHEA